MFFVTLCYFSSVEGGHHLAGSVRSYPDVIIVGAGIIGCATALALAEAGAKVEVIERYYPASMASGWTLAGVRQSGRDPAEIPLARKAVEIWQTLDEKLDFPTGYRQRGNLRLARTEIEETAIRKLVIHQSAAGLPMELLDNKQAQEIAPALTDKFSVASWCPSDGHADPIATVEGFKKAAIRLGVKFRTRLAVEKIITKTINNGRRQYNCLATSTGEIVSDVAVLASGFQTNALLKGLSLKIPMTTPVVTVLQTVPLSLNLAPVIGVANANLAVRQQLDGRIRVTGGGEQTAAHLDLSGEYPAVFPPLASVSKVIELVSEILPDVAQASIAQVWGGLLDLTPDALPVIDCVPDIDGLFVAAGFSGHGFGIGPAVGQALAAKIIDESYGISLDAFSFNRFNNHKAAKMTEEMTLHG